MSTPKTRFARPETRKLPLLIDDSEKKKIIEKWVNEDHQRLLALCEEYDINSGPQMFYDLALKLAQEHLPEPKPKRKITKWTDLAGGALVVEINRIIDSGVAKNATEAAAFSPQKGRGVTS